MLTATACSDTWGLPASVCLRPATTRSTDTARPTTRDALHLCTQVQLHGAEQIDDSLRRLLQGLMDMTGSRAACWRLLDHTRGQRATAVADMSLGDWALPAANCQPVRLSKTARSGREMQFDLLIPLDGHAAWVEPVDAVDTAVMTLNALGRWLHWLDLSHGPAMGLGPMPPHQRRVLLLMVKGLSEKQVADQLDISINTAHQYITALFRRFAVRNRPSLMARWLDQVSMLASADGWQVTQV